MLYNSIIFITVFLPLSLLGWYGLNKIDGRWGKLFIVGMSFWFYGYFNISYLWILLGSIGFNYLFSFFFFLGEKRRRRYHKILLVAGLSGNLALLFYFKYFNFFIENCNALFRANIVIREIVLPLGISFFTFQQISFLVDRYKNGAPHYKLLDYMFYVTYFPQLIAGPIVRHSDLIPQIMDGRRIQFSAERLFDGFALFSMGLAKKVLLADAMAALVNVEYENIAWLDTPTACCVICFYMLELYFDFSGYADMSRGIARMMDLELPQNFNSPFKAESVKDFWRRWHITLSGFLMQYIYIPLGGKRKGKARQCFNLFVVFLISGIWHGANWTFFVWGLMHGAAVIFETLFPQLQFKNKTLNQIRTFVFVTLSFSIFRADSLQEAVLLWKRMFTSGIQIKFVAMCNMLNYPENYAIRKLMEVTQSRWTNLMYVGTFLLVLAAGVVTLAGKQAEQWIAEKGRTRLGIFFIATLFVWSFLSLSHVSVFLYFNF